MKYKVLSQCRYDERRFDLENEKGEKFSVDIYTDGALKYPKEFDEIMVVQEFNRAFSDWLKSFIGKELEIDYIYPYAYFTGGEIKIIEN